MPQWKHNKYNIISYRCFTAKNALQSVPKPIEPSKPTTAIETPVTASRKPTASNDIDLIEKNEVIRENHPEPEIIPIIFKLITNFINMDKIKAFLVGKEAKRFYWVTLNGFIGLMIVYLSGESFVYAPIVIAVLNNITKYLNSKYGNIK